MTSFIHRRIRAFVAPDYRVACNARVWSRGLEELRRRGQGRRESGAFLLGRILDGKRHVLRFVYYDDLDPHVLDTGIIDFDGRYYSALWTICRELGLQVVADVHTHPGRAVLSATDRENPMIPQVGHIALIVPNYAQRPYRHRHLVHYGTYEYLGGSKWLDHGGRKAKKFLYIGRWART